MSALDQATAALVRCASALNDADPDRLKGRFRAAREAQAPTVWLDELVLAAVLVIGFPKALVAAAALRAVEPSPSPVGDAASYDQWPEWQRRGEATCRIIYGERYDNLRRNVAALHPALDAWIVMDGYGRTLSRPGLDLKRREFCSIAVLMGQDVPRQLHSHLIGALNAGASNADVEDVLTIIAADVTAEQASAAKAMWREIRERQSLP